MKEKEKLCLDLSPKACTYFVLAYSEVRMGPFRRMHSLHFHHDQPFSEQAGA